MPTAYLEVKKRALSLAGARLVVLRGPDKGRALRIEKEEVHIGNAPSSDLVLTDPTVSRAHCSLRVSPDGYLVTDLDSTNGTFLDGRRIQRVYLGPGDTLHLGTSSVRLEATRQTVELPLSGGESFGRLIGCSTTARRMFALLERVAPESATVLLIGETGTGKDLTAESIHERSPRARDPFVVVDCSALQRSLIESELFGHERGAFTGANQRRTGAFEDAHGGTLFLDEVDKLPMELQPKLLRALEQREVRPLGASKPIAVDVRVIDATARDLRRDVNRRLFREDLFYRLNVLSIRLPPLRERPDDIPLFAHHFLRAFTRDPHAELPASELIALIAHDWPGNLRELRNHIERRVALSCSGEAGAPVPQDESYREAKTRALDTFERRFLTALMLRAEGNTTHAARIAFMDRVNLIKLLRKHGLNRRSR
jgi:DNA-binding NtrC family response regulator